MGKGLSYSNLDTILFGRKLAPQEIPSHLRLAYLIDFERSKDFLKRHDLYPIVERAEHFMFADLMKAIQEKRVEKQESDKMSPRLKKKLKTSGKDKKAPLKLTRGMSLLLENQQPVQSDEQRDMAYVLNEKGKTNSLIKKMIESLTDKTAKMKISLPDGFFAYLILAFFESLNLGKVPPHYFK